MKPTLLVLVCVVTASLTGAGTAFLLLESEANSDSIQENQDLAQTLMNAQERIDFLEGRIERMAASRRAAPSVDVEALRALDNNLRVQIDALRSDVATLKASGVGGLNPAELLATKKGDQRLDAAMGRYLDQAMAKRDADRKKAERNRFAPFLKMRMEKDLKKRMKKLQLRPDQEERFEESVRKSMDTVMPALGVVMDPSAKKEEKIQAFGRIDDAMKAVDNDAQGYMDTQQYSTFTKQQEKQAQQMEQMRTMFGGQNNVGTNSGN